MKKATLITGASSGIGAEFAKILSKNYNLVLTARNKSQLQKVKQSCSNNNDILIITADLSDKKSVKNIFSTIKEKGFQIDMLVNNAGLGDYGPFQSSDLKKQLNMIDVNIRALTEMTHIFLKQRNNKIKNHILNISSLAGFLPGPYMSVYFATKSYVLSFSEALVEELKNKNVAVTVFCPGATKTNFAKVAGVSFPDKIPTAKIVAEKAIKAMLDEKTVVVPGINNKYLSFLPRILPRKTVREIMEKRRGPKK